MIGTLLLACCAGGGTVVLVGAVLRGDLADHAPGADSADPPGSPGLGEAVRDGQFEFTVTGLSCGHESVGEQWWRHEAQGEFCIVDLTVANIGTEARRFADGAQKAHDHEGNTYAADTGAGVVVNGNGDAVWNVINPGNSIAAKIVFDVPPGTTLTTIVLHDSPLSAGATVGLA